MKNHCYFTYRIFETFGNLVLKWYSLHLLLSSSFYIFLSIATFANVMHLIMALTLNLKIRASNFLVSVFYLATKTFSFKYQIFFQKVIDHNTNPVDFSIESHSGITLHWCNFLNHIIRRKYFWSCLRNEFKFLILLCRKEIACIWYTWNKMILQK